jgi:hypothetical protein
MKRIVEYKEEIGVFSITCPDCPLLTAFEELNQKPWACVSGMVTNMQGHVPIHTCKHYTKDSIANEAEKKLSIECGKAEP